MASITLSVSEDFKSQLNHFSWVNWSEVARGEARKKEILERYTLSGKLSSEDKEFCEKIDWHPVDELPLRREFVKDLKKRDGGKAIKVEDFAKRYGLKI